MQDSKAPEELAHAGADWRGRATQAGLARAVEMFPDDVAAAAAAAAQAVAVLRTLAPPSDEPWPAMRADAA